ncbi:Ig-like domain-containing protein, partial [Candidatus Accumulibacter vicinus]
MPNLRQALRRLAPFLLLVLIGLVPPAWAAPTVSLGAPAAGAVYLAPASVPVSAIAIASAGTTLTKVEFLDGATVLATLTASPYTFTWNNVPAGSHPLTARVTDSAGGVTTSAARTITVNATNTPPTVSLSAPAAGASYLAPANISLSATASGVEVNTPISKVEFFQGTTLIGTATASPYTVPWSNVPAGSYPLTARATDSAGGVTTSAARTITVTGTNTPPTVSLTAPAAGASYLAPAMVTLTASASGGEANTPVTK